MVKIPTTLLCSRCDCNPFSVVAATRQIQGHAVCGALCLWCSPSETGEGSGKGELFGEHGWKRWEGCGKLQMPQSSSATGVRQVGLVFYATFLRRTGFASGIGESVRLHEKLSTMVRMVAASLASPWAALTPSSALVAVCCATWCNCATALVI